MANWFEGVENLLKHPIDEIKWMADETKGVLKPLLKGDVNESWDSFKGSFGRHNDMMEDITVPLGGRNKITENPDAAAGAIIGSIFAAPVIGSAMGGSSGASSGFGGFGTEGAFSKAFQPSTEFGSSVFDKGFQGMGGNTPSFDISQGAGWKPGQSTADLNFGDMSYKPTTEFGGATPEKGFDLEALGEMLQSIKGPEEYRIQHSGGSAGRGFNFNAEQYKNKLAQREFDQMYGAQPYTRLV